jgi:hypothetical protein
MAYNITTTASTTPLSNLNSSGRQYNNNNNMNHFSVKPYTVMVDNKTTTI